jgi:hypothetical protein
MSDKIQYEKLREIAMSMGLPVKITMSLHDLRHELECKIRELLQKKRIKDDVTIVYGKSAGGLAGKRAKVVRSDVVWIDGFLCVRLKLEEERRAHSFAAHVVALHATTTR